MAQGTIVQAQTPLLVSDFVDRLKRENKAQLDSEDLPEVTRTFFNELIAERKAELS